LLKDGGLKYKIIGDEVESVDKTNSIPDIYPGIPLRIQVNYFLQCF